MTVSAREEAERSYPISPAMNPQRARVARQGIAAFEWGALYAADPDNAEIVEVMARAMWDRQQSFGGFAYITSWEDADEEQRVEYRADIRAALIAQRALMEGKG